MRGHGRVYGVLAVAALALALLAAGPRAARADTTAAATEYEVPVRIVLEGLRGEIPAPSRRKELPGRLLQPFVSNLLIAFECFRG